MTFHGLPSGGGAQLEAARAQLAAGSLQRLDRITQERVAAVRREIDAATSGMVERSKRRQAEVCDPPGRPG